MAGMLLAPVAAQLWTPAPAVAEGEPFTMDSFSPEAGFEETESGLIFRIDRPGEGKRCAEYIPNPFVKLSFEGSLMNGKVFDSTAIRRKAFNMQVGLGQRVAPGFDEAVYDMRVGEIRRVYIPPDLGFGRRGMPAGVPPNAALVYDIELLSLQPY